MRNRRTVLLCAGVLLGLALAVLPLILTRASEREAAAVTAQYVQRTGTLGNEQARRMLAQADAYNASLPAGGKTEDYEALLCVTDDAMMGYLTIPKISLTLPIYHGTGSEALKKGVGHLDYTSLPVGGKGTHAALSAHSGMSGARGFSDLPLLEEGDRFEITVLGRRLVYEVDSIATVLPTDASLLAIEPEADCCTLITCVPFGVNTHRLLVRGRRVEAPDTDGTDASGDAAASGGASDGTGGLLGSVYMRQYLLAVAVGAAIGLAGGGIVLFLKKRRRR